ncbi:uncharacterized protein BDZ83DRAFT_634674 [Colletotrichum acutatum]|uniref:Uncharacterized protein n=1 Tax=Glomerella acutata TaxID=27357 RepID=A0AAD8UFX1_GLOAC|nr:uncharacterized protein BDZ83DRAFT_634674 [Colletotrichum acutatum]KAK1716674.1 hypothetical protein BDZ83DRAFT_634674 [Colletotrichum acutatum]
MESFFPMCLEYLILHSNIPARSAFLYLKQSIRWVVIVLINFMYNSCRPRKPTEIHPAPV